jgi:hypothetical protein
VAKGSLMLLSGNGQQISQRLQLRYGSADWTTIPVEEKQITNTVQLVRLLRSEKAQVLAFGCKDLALQRFQFWLSAFLCLSGATEKLIIDEAGKSKGVNVFRFVFTDIPRFCLELVMSIWILVRAWTYLTFRQPSSLVKSTHD